MARTTVLVEGPCPFFQVQPPCCLFHLAQPTKISIHRLHGVSAGPAFFPKTGRLQRSQSCPDLDAPFQELVMVTEVRKTSPAPLRPQIAAPQMQAMTTQKRRAMDLVLSTIPYFQITLWSLPKSSCRIYVMSFWLPDIQGK